MNPKVYHSNGLGKVTIPDAEHTPELPDELSREVVVKNIKDAYDDAKRNYQRATRNSGSINYWSGQVDAYAHAYLWLTGIVLEES